MDVRSVLAERLRQHRRSLGLNQTELAERTGIPYQVISRIEHGHQSIYIERLAELAHTLNISADYLMGLTDDPTPAKKRLRSRKAAPVGEEVCDG
jgi:transcriptional regulator with XRE-family HTH domain